MSERGSDKRTDFSIRRGTPRSESPKSRYASNRYRGDDGVNDFPSSKLYTDKDMTFGFNEETSLESAAQKNPASVAQSRRISGKAEDRPTKHNNPRAASSALKAESAPTQTTDRTQTKTPDAPRLRQTQPKNTLDKTTADKYSAANAFDSASSDETFAPHSVTDADLAKEAHSANGGLSDKSQEKTNTRSTQIEQSAKAIHSDKADMSPESSMQKESEVIQNKDSSRSSEDAFKNTHYPENGLEEESSSWRIPATSSMISAAPAFAKHQTHERYASSMTQIHDNPNIYYMDGEALARPLKMPKKTYKIVILILLLAIAIGGIFLYYYFDETVNAPKREQAQIEANLNRDVSIGLPNLVSLIPLDDATIIATLESSGDTIFNLSEAKGSTNLNIVKLPEGVSVTDAGAMYLTGISKLSGSQASRLLNGSWDLSVDRSKGINISLHYADFKSGNEDTAIQSAMTSQGLAQESVTESGTDDSGNTYSIGSVDVGGSLYTWKISALPLSEIYSINGLPEDSIYVGIRITS